MIVIAVTLVNNLVIAAMTVKDRRSVRLHVVAVAVILVDAIIAMADGILWASAVGRLVLHITVNSINCKKGGFKPPFLLIV